METQKTVLVVDDEIKILEVLKAYLEKAGYAVQTACSGLEAVDAFRQYTPSLVLLDLMLPDLPGEEVCRAIRRESNVPIIMLTARVEEENILRGLSLGADDYVTKPFSPRQVIARVQAVLRRTEGYAGTENEYSFGNGELVIRPETREIIKSGRVVSMTPNEYKILLALAKYPSKIFTREELIAIAMGGEFEGFDRVIDTHIKNIRQKIEDNTRNPQYVVTVHGIGYRFGGAQ
ncbi:MAG: response regulator transcription factor [Eubacteriales bacterium]